MSSVDLETLVLASRNGDQKAFGEIVNRLAKLVTGIAYSVCGDFARSEDVGQEAFLEAWKKLAALEDTKKFTAWICTIARRKAIDEVRRTAARPATALVADPIERSESNPETIMENKQKRELVWGMLQELPETYRETLVLYYRCEKSVAEVATALGTSEPTVRQRLKRGREMLRVELASLVSDTIRSTIPKAAFSAAVIAALPATTYAAGTAGAVGTTAAAGKAGVGAAATVAGAAIMGSLLGLLGGIFGTWNSWRNAEYKSQQRFIIRQSVFYFIGFVVFLLAIGGLIYARHTNMIDNNVYRIGHLLIAAISFGFSIVWICYVTTGYKRLESQAIESGEKRRPEIASKLDQFREEARTIRKDGSTGYDAFRWNVAAWFGSALGGSVWMILSAGVLAVRGDWSAATITALCFISASVCATAIWLNRARIDAFHALNWLLVILAVLTAIVLGCFQFLASLESKNALSWHPMCWFLMLLFPFVMFQFHLKQRRTEKALIEKEKQEPHFGNADV